MRFLFSYRDSKLSSENGLLVKSISHNIFPEKENEGVATNIEISAKTRY